MFKYRENFKVLYTTADIEILIATMHRDSLDFLQAMFPHENLDRLQLLVINQTDTKEVRSMKPNIRVINTRERGLSKSRNMALRNARGAICLFTDDDVVFLPNATTEILIAFSGLHKASFIRFRAEGKNGRLLKKYPRHVKSKLSWMEVLNTSSIEMAINREDILVEKIIFDERFGLGALFPMGEEQVFLGTLKKMKKQLAYVPVSLVRHEADSSHQKLPMQERFQVQGAMTAAVFGRKGWFWVFVKLFFEVKQRSLNPLQIPKALWAARKGKKEYLKTKL